MVSGRRERGIDTMQYFPTNDLQAGEQGTGVLAWVCCGRETWLTLPTPLLFLACSN
jgi:hypothetical protein